MFPNNSRENLQQYGGSAPVLLLLAFAGTTLLAGQTPVARADEEKPVAPEISQQNAAKNGVEPKKRNSLTQVMPPPTDLLEGPLSQHWDHFSSKDGVALSDIWKIAGTDDERVLICSGDPKGFLYSKSTFSDFDLTFEWKYLNDPDGNSGILVFTQNEPRLWPTSMQVQLHQPNAGAVFPSGDAKSDHSADPTGPPLAKKIGEWNTCRITGRSGRMQVHINSRIAGEVSGCQPTTGRIAIQSEGSETHFRRMLIRVLPPVKPEKPALVDEVTTAAGNAASETPGAESVPVGDE